MTQPPSIILQDNDGGWYLVPETKVTAFESALELFNDESKHDTATRAFNKFIKYRIDGPHRLIIREWEEMS